MLCCYELRLGYTTGAWYARGIVVLHLLIIGTLAHVLASDRLPHFAAARALFIPPLLLILPFPTRTLSPT
jgi:hypothetical protein